MDTLAGTPAPRWWRNPRWIAAGLVTLLLGTLAWGLVGPESPIVVSRATTYLTAPLAADGLPDYEAGWLAALGPAPPPDENAAVLLLQTCWPLGIDATDLPAVCKALGIPDVPPTESLSLDPTKAPAAEVTDTMLKTAGQWPWTTEELPAVAAWLAKNERLIDQLVEAADRPRYWLASPNLLDGKPAMLIETVAVTPKLSELRAAARVLDYRALWHLGENRPAAAWRDIMAIRRLARLVAPPGRGPQPWFAHIVAVAVDATADLLTRQVLTMRGLPADLLATIRRDLERLGPTVALADGVASERLLAVDMAVSLAHRAPGGRRGRCVLHTQFDNRGSVVLLTSIDWTLILERLNTYHDELEAACRLTSHQARITAWDLLDSRLEGVRGPFGRSARQRIGDVLLQACSRGHRSERFAERLQGLFLEGLWGTFLRTSTRGDAQLALTKTAAALAAWHADRGPDASPYPERLDDLIPRYLASVPVDPFTDKPFIYERRGDGYLLASVGDNGVYDGGDDQLGWIVRGEWQEKEHAVDRKVSDIVVRMPIPPRKPVQE